MTVAVLVFCFTSGAQAQMRDTGLFIGAGVGYAWEDFEKDFDADGRLKGSRKIDDSWGFNLFGGYRFMKYLSFEGNFTIYNGFDVKTSSGTDDLDIWTLMLDTKLMYPVFDQKLVPYLRLGGGFMNAEVESFDENELAWNIGGGVDFFVTPSVSLGVDCKYVQGTGDLDDIQYVVGSAGIAFHF